MKQYITAVIWEAYEAQNSMLKDDINEYVAYLTLKCKEEYAKRVHKKAKVKWKIHTRQNQLVMP